MKNQTMTAQDAIERVIDALDGPTPLDQVVQRALAMRSTQSKNPEQLIRNKIRQTARPTWVWLDRYTLWPMRLAMKGVRFRITPSQTEVEHSLLAGASLYGFTPPDLPWEAMQFIDAAGNTLSFDLTAIEEKMETLFGEGTGENHGFQLSAWFERTGFRFGDSILATIVDWEKGRLLIEHEPASQRRQDVITHRNQELADLFYHLLEETRYEGIYVFIAVPTVYARMDQPDGYPGDHWIEVLRQDQRMVWMSYKICYADSLSSFMATFFSQSAAEPPPISPEQGRQVYRFKAMFKHRPGLWRQIEIQGEQTLRQFNDELRGAFNHDWDHMGGFWKRVRRGQTKHFREIDLGSIDPFGEGDAANTTVASLDLQPGDELKYVYDFGDWIEHTLTLEEIAEPETGVTYPRVATKNRPSYRYCERCKEQGRKTIARYICISCSDQQQRSVLLCGGCVDEKHEEHYTDELRY